MIILIISGILVFISCALLLNFLYPRLEHSLFSWQKRRTQKIVPRLEEMFIEVPYTKLLFINTVIPLALGGLAFFFTRISWMGLIAGFIGVLVPNFWVKQKELFRKRKFEDQLVDGLMLLSGSLKAGLSLIQAFEALAEEMPAPISQEFSLVLRQNRMGIPLEECLVGLKRRMPGDDLDMIITAILVARETGGDITTIFSNLVMTIRERSRLLRKVKALCTQGKLQGRIMMCLPVFFGYAVYKLDPNMVRILMNDQQGKLFLAYAIFSEIMGIFLISRLSKVEI